jgi:hypothetical protein
MNNNKRYEYRHDEIGVSMVSDPVAPYGVVAVIGNGMESRIAERHTLEEAKSFINKRFRELYQVDYDAI